MYTKNDWSKAAINLTKRTIEDKVKWNIPTDAVQEDGRTIKTCFETTYKGLIYLVISYKIQSWLDEDIYWEDYIVLEIWKPVLGYRHTKIAASPTSLSALQGLLSTVEGKFAVDQNALGALLEDD